MLGSGGFEYLALAVHPGEHIAPVPWHHQLDLAGDAAHPVADRAQQFINPLAGRGRHRHRTLAALGQAGRGRTQVALVVHHQFRNLVRLDLD